MLGCGVTTALLAVMHLVNRTTIQSRVVDMDQEANVPTWFSGGVFLLAGVGALVAYGQVTDRRAGRAWAALGLLAVAFSLDELASFHEIAGQRLGPTTTLSVTQPLAVTIVVALLLWIRRRLPARAGRWLLVASGTLLAAQLCATVAGLALDGAARTLVETLEDAGEMLTATALLAAAFEGLGHRLSLGVTSARSEVVCWMGRSERDARREHVGPAPSPR